MTTKPAGPSVEEQKEQSAALAEEKQQWRLSICMSLAERHFGDFLDFVYIFETSSVDGTGGARRKFTKWPHLMEMVEALRTKRLIVVLKARQLGFSWIVAAYSIWLCLFHEYSVVLLLSLGQNEAKDLLAKARFIYANLPPAWHAKLGTDSTQEMSFPATHSEITALPATKDAGRGKSASLVVQDEAEKHEYLGDNYFAVKPTVDSSGGQMIMGSTADKKKISSLFKELFRGAPEDGWEPLFWPWHARPDRDQSWYAQKRVEVAVMPEAQEISPELYMEQEYPASAAEALAPGRALAAFDHDRLREMQEHDIRQPIRSIDGRIHIYRDWRPGVRYAAGTDTSHGGGGDYGATVVLERDSGVVVADIIANDLKPNALASLSMKMLEVYRNPIWGIENNDWGKATVDAALNEKYPRLYKVTTQRGTTQYGWHTNIKTRVTLWNDMIEAVATGSFHTPNEAGLEQFFSVIRNPEKEMRPEAMKGAHDDYPMAAGIAWQMRAHSFGEAMTIKVKRR